VSLTIKAYTVIGCKIDRSILFPAEDQARSLRAEELLEEWRDAEEGFRIAVDMNDNEYAGPFVLEVAAEESSCSLHILEKDILSLEGWRKTTKEHLEPFGLWDPKTFGIHTIVCY
jgi:hypothetical protein